MRKTAYLIVNVEEYGKLISFCINNDISVWRTYWDEREKGERCFQIDWIGKRCYYSSKRFYESEGYEIITPIFYVDSYGNYKIKDGK